MSDKPNIVVLAGGFSEEKEVSYNTGKAIYDSLVKQKYGASLIDPAAGQSLLDDSGKLLAPKTNGSIMTGQKYQLEKALGNNEKPDLVFLALHGGAGEDGTIQALFDLAGIKYTGSGQLASSAAMNKAFLKDIARAENIPTPAWTLYEKPDRNKFDAIAHDISGRYDLPLIIKPNDSGSTVGLTLVKDNSQIAPALGACLEVSENILVEQYVKGRELTAAILFGEKLPLVEIVPSGELYDYKCKYTAGGSSYYCPANIDEKLKSAIQEYASIIYNKIKCSGLARVDFLLDENNRPYFLELNTLPGMTELSLAPMAAKEAGMSFDDLIDKIVKGSLANG